jgi:hypothetical protein
MLDKGTFWKTMADHGLMAFTISLQIVHKSSSK